MPQSLSKIYLHLIFSTKCRQTNIQSNIKAELHAYMGGILNSLGCPVIIVGGMSDHVHLLFCMNRKKSVSDIVKELKANTTIWYKKRIGCNFAWQRGYAIFSVSQSQVENVLKYIENQEVHHKKQSFKEEYRAFLKGYKINFDETYVWD